MVNLCNYLSFSYLYRLFDYCININIQIKSLEFEY